MARHIMATVLVLFACGAARSQPANQTLTFEVASVKPSPPRKTGEPMGRVGCYRAPGSKNRFLCTRASLSLIVQYAYDLEPYELRPPVSTDNSEFNIEAIVPSGATAEQIPLMLKNLLTERFKLAFHRETAEVKGYALVVARSGLKIKESSNAPTSGAAKPATGPVKDPDGFVYIPGLRNYVAMSRANGLTRWVANDVGLDSEIRNTPRLTQLLYSVIHQPVIDATGLKGKYDFTLTFNADIMETGAAPTATEGGGLPQPSDIGPTIFKAAEEQLGLKLEPRKIAVNLLVIDHAEKTPGEN
jgi:uncharacterized protein (TIGR03435 family)